jgi:alginate O-acetyltransferase complex protein AlgI
MLFNSFDFIFVFLPACFVLFCILKYLGKSSFSILFLVFASIYFYAYWDYKYVALLIASMLFNFFAGLFISNQKKYRKIALIIAIIIDLSLLCYYKYYNFFVGNIKLLINSNIEFHQLILPLGISFFTFNQIAYLVDVYKNEVEEQNIISFFFFVTFFPHLIAGPIVHYKEIHPQLKLLISKSRNQLDSSIIIKNICLGCTLFSIGLFKKVLIADSFAYYSNLVFNSINNQIEVSQSLAWVGLLSYTIQLYFDFSGYSDMALGAALLFNIKFPINFDSPYKSISIIEFWRRWHISLSNFLKDYVYIPLGGSRKGRIRQYVNLIATMLLGGLWHGGGWNFVVWGLIHGVCLTINHIWNFIWSKSASKPKNKYSEIRSIFFARLLTFSSVVMAWVYFRTTNLSSASLMFTNLFIGSSDNSFGFTSRSDFITISMGIPLALLVIFFLPNSNQITAFLNKNISVDSPTKINSSVATCAGLLTAITFFISTKIILSAPSSDFLYFNF